MKKSLAFFFIWPFLIAFTAFSTGEVINKFDLSNEVTSCIYVLLCLLISFHIMEIYLYAMLHHCHEKIKAASFDRKTTGTYCREPENLVVLCTIHGTEYSDMQRRSVHAGLICTTNSFKASTQCAHSLPY